jgi:hypothetical protein
MFITHKPAEIFLSAYLGDDSTQYWQYVEQTTHCPWFTSEWVDNKAVKR